GLGLEPRRAQRLYRVEVGADVDGLSVARPDEPPPAVLERDAAGGRARLAPDDSRAARPRRHAFGPRLAGSPLFLVVPKARQLRALAGGGVRGQDVAPSGVERPPERAPQVARLLERRDRLVDVGGAHPGRLERRRAADRIRKPLRKPGRLLRDLPRLVGPPV